MVNRRDILEKSNTFIRKMKKGVMVDAIIGLKSLINDMDTNASFDSMSIQLAELTEINEKLTADNEKLRKSIINYKNEVGTLNRKGAFKAAAVISLQDKIIALNEELDAPWYKKIF